MGVAALRARPLRGSRPGYWPRTCSRRASVVSMSASVDDQRRQQAHGRGPGRVDDEPLLEQRAAHDVGRVDVELDTRSSARGRGPRDHVRELASRSRRIVAELAHAREQRPRRSARRARRSAAAHDDRPAGERRAVVAGHEHVGAAAAPVTSAPIGSPPPSALARGQRVGHDARLLVGPQRARCARARSGSRRRSAPRRARSQAARAAAAASSASTWTPVSPWIGSRITAAVCSSTASASACGVGVDRAEAGHERRERRLLGLLRRRATARRRCGRGRRRARPRRRRPARPCARA